MPFCQGLGLELSDGELFCIGLLGVERVSGGVQDLKGVVVATIPVVALRLEIPHEYTLILGYHILLLL